VLGAGLIVGSFYGLAPLYASQQGLSTEQVGLFMGSCIFAGLLVQWPLGWLSDRYDRALLIRVFADSLGGGVAVGDHAAGAAGGAVRGRFLELAGAVLPVSAGGGVFQRPSRAIAGCR
jgi:MFS family permease